MNEKDQALRSSCIIDHAQIGRNESPGQGTTLRSDRSAYLPLQVGLSSSLIYWLYSSIHMAAVSRSSVDKFQPHQCLTPRRHGEAVCPHSPPRSILSPSHRWILFPMRWTAGNVGWYQHWQIIACEGSFYPKMLVGSVNTHSLVQFIY